jgi:phosphate transport system substrate-binding protein
VPASAQAPIEVCLKSGVLIRAARIESREGKFLLYPEGGGPAIEMPDGQVKGIGIPCTSAQPPVQTSGVQKFGIYGSNTIGERLMPLLIDALATKSYGQKSLQRPRPVPEEMDIEIRQSGAAEPVALIDYQSKGSGTSAKALQEKKASIGMSSRRITNEEAASIASQYNVDMRTPGNEHVLALDGLAVIVHPDNPIKQLTLDDIARIFAGEITNWKDVLHRDASGREITGFDRKISLHSRDNKSGTYDTFVALVLAAPGLPKRQLGADAKRYESSENLSDAVSKDPGAIGFIGLPYINKNHPLSIGSTCGLLSAPSKFTVKTEEYPLARRLYLYTIGTPNEPVARSLLQFALSDDAQPTVVEAEFVDQAVEFQDNPGQRQWREALMSNPSLGLTPDKQVATNATRQFGGLTQSLRRSTIVFRFEAGKSDLDVRAQQDVDRLARYLQSPAVRGRQFYIAGFADSTGGWSNNLQLSSQRAARVVSELQKRGVTIPSQNIVPLSYLAPVACNDSPAGQAKNRRVEVWIAQ